MKWKRIILINKEEAQELNTKHKIPYGENGISSSKNKRHKKFYLCEKKNNLKLLSEIRNRKQISIFEKNN